MTWNIGDAPEEKPKAGRQCIVCLNGGAGVRKHGELKIDCCTDCWDDSFRRPEAIKRGAEKAAKELAAAQAEALKLAEPK